MPDEMEVSAIMSDQIDDEVIAAWRVLAARGLVSIEWEGLSPVGVMSADLVHVAASRPLAVEAKPA
jgi:hypothetical protein